jgi:predicted transposase YbfD/YdcC
MQPIKERFSFQEIDTRIMNGATDKGAEVAYRAALKQLMLQMIEDHPIRVVDLKCKKVVRRKKKNAAATYLYQADCDGGWGEIYIDFENKYLKIERLAEWDTTISHIYAWKAIGFIVANRAIPLPKKRRIIFEKTRIFQSSKS